MIGSRSINMGCNQLQIHVNFHDNSCPYIEIFMNISCISRKNINKPACIVNISIDIVKRVMNTSGRAHLRAEKGSAFGLTSYGKAGGPGIRDKGS